MHHNEGACGERERERWGLRSIDNQTLKTPGMSLLDMLGTLLHSCPHFVGQKKIIKKKFFNYRYVLIEKTGKTMYICSVLRGNKE